MPAVLVGLKALSPRRSGAMLDAEDGMDRERIRDPRRVGMLSLLLERGIEDAAVLHALAQVPRERFVPSHLQARAYADGPLPIGAGQTISQPYMVAAMVELARPDPARKVLEVGTGSGYGAAVLAGCFGTVITIERLPALAEAARERLAALGCDNVTVVVGDGSRGYPEAAPYDAIVVTAAGPKVPDSLIAQLAPGGRLIIPVGPRGCQELTTVDKRADGSTVRSCAMRCVFVPLVGEEAWHSPS